MSQRHPALFIAPSSVHGRGVFAAEPIEKGEIIEICPVLVVPAEQKDLIHKSVLYDYYFLWGEAEEEVAIILGYGSIFNHSYAPNAEYVPDFENQTLSIFCYKKIEAGDEITLNYNGDPEEQAPVWFDEKGSK